MSWQSAEETSHECVPECIACQVTGIGYVGGFARPDLSPEMAGVQCEMCHGPGGRHLDALLEE